MNEILKCYNHFLQHLSLITSQWETVNHIDHSTKEDLMYNAQSIQKMLKEYIKTSDNKEQFLFD